MISSSSSSSPPCCASPSPGGGGASASGSVISPGYPGSATLPASITTINPNLIANNNSIIVNGYSSSSSDCYHHHHHNCARSSNAKTLPNLVLMGGQENNGQGLHQWHYSPCSISLFVLSLVFILIWSSLLSGLLVTHSFKEHQTARHMAELFVLHKDVGQLAFAVGEEMLDSINSSLTTINHLNSNKTSEELQDPPSPNIPIVKSKWNETDQLLQQVVQSLAHKGFVDLEIVIKQNLFALRTKCFDRLSALSNGGGVSSENSTNEDSTRNPNEHHPYSLLLDCVRTFDKLFFRFDTILLKDNQWLSERHSKLTLTDLSIRNMPYTLFIRGIVHRFTALGLGLIFVRSNYSHSVFNVSEYFNYYYSSRQLIESSFVWNVRFLEKYLELENTDYKSDMLLNLFNNRQTLEQDNYLKMVDIFGQIFNYEFLTRIRSHIKKKNVESVERLLVNGSRTKFVTDQDANLLNVQLNTDMLEAIGLEKLDQIISFNYNQVSHLNLSQKYDQLLRNQIGFMGRVQDFLNISIYAHLTQISLNEQQNFLYHSVVASILILSVLFCLSLFLCSYCCSGNGCQSSSSVHATSYPGSKSLSRRMRRHFWNISSSSSLFKSCFASSTGTPSTSRYPLLYKASSHPHNQQQQHHYHAPHSRSACFLPSPSSYHSANHKRPFGNSNLVARHPVSLGTGSSGLATTKTALLTYKFENSRLGKLTETTTTTTSLSNNNNNPEPRSSPSKSPNSRSNWCCGTCTSDTSKCSTCCSCTSRDVQPASTVTPEKEKSSSSFSTTSSSSSSTTSSKNSPSKESKKSILSTNCSTSPLATCESTDIVNGGGGGRTSRSSTSTTATDRQPPDTDSSSIKTGTN